MRKLRAKLALILLFACYAASLRAAETFVALCYHDIQDTVPAKTQTITLGSDELVAQFSWLYAHDYHPIGLDDLIAARDGRRPLPDKAVLLTFDDGYQSMYTRVYPLLKLYHFPAVLALVTGWMEHKSGENIRYDDEQRVREQLLSWDQVREMEKSGLVEVVSHSDELHHGILANPQGNELPAPATRLYDKTTGRYEDDDHYRSRIRDDLDRSIQIIQRELGHKPRAVVWPYGSYTKSAIDIAKELGIPITLNLADGEGDVQHLQSVPRYLIRHNTRLSDFVWRLLYKGGLQPMHVAHVDLDYIYDPDPAQQEKNLGLLIERIKQLEINTVFLQAFADPDGDGSAAALYFPNRHLPMRANLFSHAAHQLRTRALVKVYAWLPVLAYKLPDGNPAAHLTVQQAAQRDDATDRHYRRLSPFYPEVRRLIGDIYVDLAKYDDFDGILFHDDAYFTGEEDDSPAALAHYQEAWGLPATIGEIHRSAADATAWSRHKTQFLLDFTDELTARVREYRPDIKTARNIYAAVIMDPRAEAWFAQSLPAFLEHYDYAAVMAMPQLEGASQPRQWLTTLANRVIATPGATPRTVFELQAEDWSKKMPLHSVDIAANMALLRRRGITNFGYYPDDFATGHPAIRVIEPQFSLRANPYR